MKCRVSIGDWATQGEAARAVRYEVFVIGQNIPIELEWDEMDARSLHALALDEQGRPLGTGRLLPDSHIGRMAVLDAARGQGIGSAILEALMRQARARGDASVLLHAQIHAEPFYRRHGFMREGEEFIEAGIPHILMRHVFSADS
jgi:predicted GNAT family N-acyltransferase